MSEQIKQSFRNVGLGDIFSHLGRLFVKTSDTELQQNKSNAFHPVYRVLKKGGRFIKKEIDTLAIYPNEKVLIVGHLSE